jgi:hypothetical protein
MPTATVKCDLCAYPCGISVIVCTLLHRAGVDCYGLTVGAAGLIVSLIIKNNGKLPEAWAFLKCGEGTMRERRSRWIAARTGQRSLTL